ncbi:hypothetical protein [Thalassovita taeanensis]|uniref:Uncharacterized protein n=1 Tax=Thalassovita taeanensis TaxID=657014 RepID=A0A1H9F1E9_9RHOB|nr:hypothetical protein [Thalassovita taeanensis]SEQ31283.1 hypothetical protein SAMN04488092_105238 [Thalassovita taeanensis]
MSVDVQRATVSGNRGVVFVGFRKPQFKPSDLWRLRLDTVGAAMIQQTTSREPLLGVIPLNTMLASNISSAAIDVTCP